jgi:hypothetical protein
VKPVLTEPLGARDPVKRGRFAAPKCRALHIGIYNKGLLRTKINANDAHT